MNRKEIVKASTQLYNYKKQLGETITFDDGFVDGAEWMQKQTQAEIDELTNKVSELTEALDASHIFCEGVKDAMIKKACKWFEDWLCNDEEWMRRSDFVVKNVEQLKQAMKGE